MDDMQLKIEVPTDNQGYVLLKCPLCGAFFKITASDCEDDNILRIFCPSCGLSSYDYFTEDVIELATATAQNIATDVIYKEMKKWEKQFSNSFIKFKVGKRPQSEPENLIKSGIDVLSVTKFRCCRKSAKIKPMLRITGCYCPFCGVKEYELE